MADPIELHPDSPYKRDQAPRVAVNYRRPRLSFGQFALRSTIFVVLLSVGVSSGVERGIERGTQDTRAELDQAQIRLRAAEDEARNLEATLADLITATEESNIEALGQQAELANQALERARGVYYCPLLQSVDLASPVAIDNWCQGSK